MKEFRPVFIFLCLLMLISCQANANKDVLWNDDGTVTASNGKTVKLDIQSVYDSLTYAGDTFLAGFKIDRDGNNYPYIVSLNEDLSSIQYWQFDHIPNDIFVYQSLVHLNTTDGQLFAFRAGKWELEKATFPPNSQVVYSNNSNELIVCFHASLEKSVRQPSGCMSISKKRENKFTWLRFTPKVCNNKLYVIEESKGSNIFKQVSIESGKVIASQLISKVPDDLCQLKY